MTRKACVTVRLPGARTAPATSTWTCCQTGAVEHERKTASQETRTVGTGEAAWASVRLGLIVAVESTAPDRARGHRDHTPEPSSASQRVIQMPLRSRSSPGKMRKVELILLCHSLRR